MTNAENQTHRNEQNGGFINQMSIDTTDNLRSKPRFVEGEYCPTEFTDSPAFKDLVSRMETWLKDKGTIFLIDFIRAFPNDERWLMSAIAMSKHIEVIEGYRDKYRHSPTPVMNRVEYGDTARLFAGNVRYENREHIEVFVPNARSGR